VALINKEGSIRRIREGLEKLPEFAGYEILSYKRNRGLDLLRIEAGLVLVRERGYREAEYRVSMADLEKLLKSLFRFEFPRSRQLRLYQLASPEERGQTRKRL